MPGVARTSSNPQRLNPQISRIRQVASLDPDRFIESQLQVTYKSALGGKLSGKFQLSFSQRKISEKIEQMKQENRPVRLYVLKSRQVGSSTYGLARFFTDVWANDNLEAVIIAQQEQRAKELLQRCKFFYQSMNPGLKLALSQDSKYGLQFADTRGQMTIVSAESINVVRGGTKQRVMFSEFAYYSRPLNVLQELEQLVDLSPATEILIETTGRGHGSQAHEYWNYCRSGHDNYETLFLPWQDDPANDHPFFKTCTDKQRDQRMAEVFDFEPRLKERMRHYKLTPGNVWWAYEILKFKCKGDYEFFLQEYPCDEYDCWRATGLSYFGVENLNSVPVDDFEAEYLTFGEKASLGEMFNSLDDLDVQVKVDENSSTKPFIKVWKRPIASAQYVVSGDSASGQEDGNFSSSFVIDMRSLEMMAEFHGKVRPDEHAFIIASLGEIYNNAVAAPEVNPPGNVTIDYLKRIYSNIYRWRYLDDYKLRLSNKIGWQTNTSSRPLMLELSKRIVSDIAHDRVLSKGIIKSRFLLEEMKTFTVDGFDGKPEAAGDNNDDRVMAWAIALFVASQETHGTDSDILSLYKTQPTDPQPIYASTHMADPAEVIRDIDDAFRRRDSLYGFHETD